MEANLWWKTTFDCRQTLMEGNIRWKAIFEGRRPLIEDSLWWKTTYDEIHPLKTHFDKGQNLMENKFWWTTTFDGRQKIKLLNRPLTLKNQLLFSSTSCFGCCLGFLYTPPNQNLHCYYRETNFNGKWTLLEDDLWGNTTFDGKHPEDNQWWKTTFDGRRSRI